MRKQGDQCGIHPEATRIIPRLAPGGLYGEHASRAHQRPMRIQAPMRKHGGSMRHPSRSNPHHPPARAWGLVWEGDPPARAWGLVWRTRIPMRINDQCAYKPPCASRGTMRHPSRSNPHHPPARAWGLVWEGDPPARAWGLSWAGDHRLNSPRSVACPPRMPEGSRP